VFAVAEFAFESLPVLLSLLDEASVVASVVGATGGGVAGSLLVSVAGALDSLLVSVTAGCASFWAAAAPSVAFASALPNARAGTVKKTKIAKAQMAEIRKVRRLRLGGVAIGVAVRSPRVSNCRKFSPLLPFFLSPREGLFRTFRHG
jgi:hypothetical protein